MYEYRIQNQIDLQNYDLRKFYKYENLINSKYIQLKERECIEYFIKNDEDAINIYMIYLKDIIYSDILTKFEEKNKGKI